MGNFIDTVGEENKNREICIINSNANLDAIDDDARERKRTNRTHG